VEEAWDGGGESSLDTNGAMAAGRSKAPSSTWQRGAPRAGDEMDKVLS